MAKKVLEADLPESGFTLFQWYVMMGWQRVTLTMFLHVITNTDLAFACTWPHINLKQRKQAFFSTNCSDQGLNQLVIQVVIQGENQTESDGKTILYNISEPLNYT